MDSEKRGEIMLADYHIHLENGPFTLDWLERFIKRTDELGIEEIGVAEHFYRFVEARSCLYNDHIAPRQTQHLEEYLELMVRAQQKGWPVRIGLEVDYIPGKEAAIERALKELPLDFVIGSVHWLGDWCFDSDPASWEGRDLAAVYHDYYITLAQAVESKLFDILGHPGNIAYFGHRAAPDAMRRAEDTWLTRIKGKNICIEVNTGGLLRQARAHFPRLELLRRICDAGFDITLASDAHWPEDVGHGFTETHRLLLQMGFKHTCRFHQRQRKLQSL